MRKRLISIVLVAIMCVGLTGCAKEDTSFEAPEVKKAVEITKAPELSGEQGASKPAEVTPEPVEVTPEPTIEPEIQLTDVTSDEYIEKVCSAYESFLWNNGFGDDIDWENVRFTMAFVDEDDVPELIVGEGMYHAAGAHVCMYDANSGEVKDLGVFGEYGSVAYDERKGRVYGMYMGMGCEYFTIYEIRNLEAVCVKSFFEDSEQKTYEIDDVSTDEETYRKEYQNWAAGESTYADYNNMISMYDSRSSLLTVITAMYKAKLRGESFLTYMTPEMLDMAGIWELQRAEMYGRTDDIRTEDGKGDIASSIAIFEDGSFNLWISVDSEGVYYSVPEGIMYFFDGAMYDGCDNDEWSVILNDNEYGDRCFATLVNDDMLHILYEQDNGSTTDTIQLWYQRAE